MSEENKPTEQSPDNVKPKYNWEYKKDFGINVKMKEILKATLTAAQAERDRLIKKLERLQHGG